jgi:hypothetical protein
MRLFRFRESSQNCGTVSRKQPELRNDLHVIAIEHRLVRSRRLFLASACKAAYDSIEVPLGPVLFLLNEQRDFLSENFLEWDGRSILRHNVDVEAKKFGYRFAGAE